MGRAETILLAVVTAALGAAGALVIDRLWPRPQPPGASAPPPPAPRPLPPPEPADPGPARALTLEALADTTVPKRSIEHGLYPLRGPGRAPDATLDLVSFDCPSGEDCLALLGGIEARARGAGLSLVGPRGGDRPGRPRLRALVEGDRPALALRAMPSGPRLTVIVGGIGRDPALLEAALTLPPHVAVAVLPEAEASAGAWSRLQGQARETLLHLPLGPDEASAPAPGAITLSAPPQAARARLEALLAAAPGVIGVLPLGGARITASRGHMSALHEVLRGAGHLYLDGDDGVASVAGATAKALGVRQAAITHRLAGTEADLGERLRAVEAALALDGRAVLLVEASPAALAALKPWLDGVARRGLALLRPSEIAL